MIGFTIMPSHIDYSKIVTQKTIDNLIMGDCIIISGQAKELVHRVTGALCNSIMWTTHKTSGGFNQGGQTAAPVTAKLSRPDSSMEGYVGSNLEYAAAIETGIAKPYWIYPKNGRFLAWKGSDGKMHFARRVKHPAQAAIPFLRPACDYTKRQREARHKGIINAAIKEAYNPNPGAK